VSGTAAIAALPPPQPRRRTGRGGRRAEGRPIASVDSNACFGLEVQRKAGLMRTFRSRARWLLNPCSDDARRQSLRLRAHRQGEMAPSIGGAISASVSGILAGLARYQDCLPPYLRSRSAFEGVFGLRVYHVDRETHGVPGGRTRPFGR
jgi:hypothetical protein